MATVHMTKDNFEDIITKNDFVIIDFWAPWCGPCQFFGPIYEETSEKYPDVVFAKVDTQDEQELGGYFQIRSIPTLMIFREQVIIYSQAGALQASAFEELIGKARALDMAQVHAEIAAQQQTEDAAQS